MDTFDQIVRSLIPTGNGDHTATPPCSVCASNVMLLDPEPRCMGCDMRAERLNELAEQLAPIFDEIHDIALAGLSPSGVENLRLDLMLWNIWLHGIQRVVRP